MWAKKKTHLSFFLMFSSRSYSRGEGPRFGPGHPQTDGWGEGALGASERTHRWLAESGGPSLGAPPGAAEFHGPARPAADSGRGGQSCLAARGRPAYRRPAGPHRQDRGESEALRIYTSITAHAPVIFNTVFFISLHFNILKCHLSVWFTICWFSSKVRAAKFDFVV